MIIAQFHKCTTKLDTQIRVLCLLVLISGLVMAPSSPQEMSSDAGVAANHDTAAPSGVAWSVSLLNMMRQTPGLAFLAPREAASGMTISGTVFYSTTPVANVRVDRTTSTGTVLSSTITDAGGQYSLTGVPAGNYFLWMHGPTSEYMVVGYSVSVGSTDVRMDLYLPKKITLVSPPNQSTAATRSPIFCWQGLPEAINYTFQLNKTSDWTLIDFIHNIQGNCYSTTQTLQRGVQYTWQIDALDRFSHDIGGTYIQFTFNIEKPSIVLVHGWEGLAGLPSTSNCDPTRHYDSDFAGVGQELSDAGFSVTYAHLMTSPCSTPSIGDNVVKLKEAIAAAKASNASESKVILIAHSMGGLVARAYVEGPGYQNDVAALFTFGSPHLGVPEDAIVNALNQTTFGAVCTSQQGACDFSVSGMKLFNLGHHQNNAVTYHVISGNATFLSLSPLGRFLYLFVHAGDGIVPIDSGTGLAGTFDRWTTDEVHATVLGPHTYFVRDGGSSTSYTQCIKKVIVDGALNCGSVSTASLAQASNTPTLAQHTPVKRGKLPSGQTAAYNISLENGPALFAAEWQTGALTFTLVDPNGRTINPSFAAVNPRVVTYSGGSNAATYYFPNAISGTWRLRLQATSAPAADAAYSMLAAFDSSIALTGNSNQQWYSPGSIATITASITGSPSSLTLTGSVLRTDGLADTLSFVAKGNGQYQASYPVPNAPGYAEVRLLAAGTTASNLPFQRGTSVVFQISPKTFSLNGHYADAASAYPGLSLYQFLNVTAGINATVSGKVGLSADLVDGTGNFVAHAITGQDVTAGASVLTLPFSGTDILASRHNGPYTLTNLLLTDETNATMVTQQAKDVYATAPYQYTDFADIVPPQVVSIMHADSNPTSALSVHFRVTFSEAVTGVDMSAPFSDFALITTGVKGSTITGVSGSGKVYTVTATTGSGNGTMRLDLVDDNTIVDAAGNPLGGLDLTDGDFSQGQVYSVRKSLTAYSNAAVDGWVLERSETSNTGGMLNSIATTFNIGDDAARRQYRAMLSFSTGNLPDNAAISKVTVRLKQQGIVGGGNPITMLQGLIVDIKKGFFGPAAAFAVADFQAPASATLGPFKPTLADGWYSIDLTAGKAYVNKLSSASGLTQFRLRFKLDDNNNSVANYLSVYSGNAPAANQPQLIVQYYIP